MTTHSSNWPRLMSPPIPPASLVVEGGATYGKKSHSTMKVMRRQTRHSVMLPFAEVRTLMSLTQAP